MPCLPTLCSFSASEKKEMKKRRWGSEREREKERERESESGRDCCCIQLTVLFAVTHDEVLRLEYTAQ